MPIADTTLAQGVEEDGKDRQRVVSWAYPGSKRHVLPSIIHPKPPHYHDSLSNSLHACGHADSLGRHAGGYRCEISGNKESDVLDAEELNVDLLVGAKCAEDALKSYEIDAGFYHAIPDSQHERENRNLCRVITEEEIAVGKGRWAELVRSLTRERSSPRFPSPRDHRRQDLRSPTSSEFFDLTDSEHSVDSDPAPLTPTPRSYANVTVKEPSPGPSDFSPPRSLNATASSFIPTSTPSFKMFSGQLSTSLFSRHISSPSPTDPTFTCPSVSSSIQACASLPPTLKKDEQGFYTEVPRPPAMDQISSSHRAQRSSTSLLPPFLADPSRRPRRTSKTREIVDQLRSASVNDFDRPQSRSCIPIRPVSTPHQLALGGMSLLMFTDECTHRSDGNASFSSGSAVEDFDEAGDGWLRAEVEDSDGDPVAKARRTRDLVQALGRSCPNSTQGSDSDINQKDADWEVFAGPTEQSRKASKEGSSTRRKGARHRSRKSHGAQLGSSKSSPSAAPPITLSASSLPPTQPFYAAYPIYTTPSTYTTSPYKTMQIPTQIHCVPVHAAYAGGRFGSMTMFPSVVHLPPSTSSMNAQSGFDRSGITGAAGIRHTPW